MGMMTRFDKISKRLDEIQKELIAIEIAKEEAAIMGEPIILLEHTEKFLRNMHKASACKGQHCTMHKRSDHHMRSFPQKWEDYYMWRVCPHDVKHPDPDEINKDAQHKCDGCCYLKETLDD